jgi:hypothetical protein
MGYGTMENLDFSKLIVKLYELVGYLPCTMHGKSLETFAPRLEILTDRAQGYPLF